MSLNELKATTTAPNTTLKDRSASKEDMDKLKISFQRPLKEEVPTPGRGRIQTLIKIRMSGKN